MQMMPGKDYAIHTVLLRTSEPNEPVLDTEMEYHNEYARGKVHRAIEQALRAGKDVQVFHHDA